MNSKDDVEAFPPCYATDSYMIQGWSALPGGPKCAVRIFKKAGIESLVESMLPPDPRGGFECRQNTVAMDISECV